MGRVYPLALLAVFSLFYTGIVVAQAANVEAPPAAPGAVGAVGGFLPPPPVLRGGVYVLTLTLMKTIIEDLKLRDRAYFTGPPTLAATLSSAGEYPAPTYPYVTALLTSPVEEVPGPERLVKDITVISPKTTEEFYSISTKKVIDKYFTASRVILARRDPSVDGMASVGWSRATNTPILPVEQNSIPNATLAALRTLEPLRIVIVGGPVAVSESVEAELSKMAEVERIWGADRFETAVEVAGMIEFPKVVVVADGLNPGVDALIISGEYGAPLVYVKGSKIPRVTGEYLLKHKTSPTYDAMTWVLVGVDRETATEIKAMYDLPDILTKERWIIRIYKVGSKILSLAGGD
jgi:putative cell wall-binding protein